MKISHVFGKKRIEENKAGNVAFMLTNKTGGYSLFFGNSVTKYNGAFFRLSRMYRVIENISLVDKANVSEITNKLYMAERVKEGIKEGFFMPHNYNSLVYELNKEHEFEVFLDIKEAYDNRSLGRIYGISEENGLIIVKFTKKTDVKEDKTHGEEEYSAYLAIRTDSGNYKKNEKWELRKYPLDKKRNTSFERHVYNAITIKAKKAVFSFAENREAAVREANYAYENSEMLKKKQKGYYSRFREDDFPLFCAKSSLDNLITAINDNLGIYAGLPWFFQFWTRDEAISLKAAMLIKRREIAKKIAKRQAMNILDDGRIPNIVLGSFTSITGNAPPAASCDGVGWAFRRIMDIIGMRKKEFSKEEKKIIAGQLELSIARLRENYEKEGLIMNNELETWMDTNAENGEDKRAGARIEIQALQLSMYKLAYQLTKKKEYKKLEEWLRNKVREKFWNGRILADGLEDFTIRPNIFLACYIYPELLTREEWEMCFDNSIPRLWLDWGGLSTIDKSHPLFRSEQTGEAPWSYHRGDSWFWINNLAAIVMHRINKEKFESYIKKIVEASREDILWKGIIGAHSELSSAKEQRAEGCLNQAWSSAMFVEMMEELREK